MDTKEKLKAIVANARGDDLERAMMVFGSMSSDELASEHGASGRTCRQVLEDCRQERREWQAAKDLLDSLLMRIKPL